MNIPSHFELEKRISSVMTISLVYRQRSFLETRRKTQSLDIVSGTRILKFVLLPSATKMKMWEDASDSVTVTLRHAQLFAIKSCWGWTAEAEWLIDGSSIRYLSLLSGAARIQLGRCIIFLVRVFVIFFILANVYNFILINKNTENVIIFSCVDKKNNIL